MAKAQYLQWRADDNDRALAKRLANDYGVSVSSLFRLALQHIDTHRPILTTTITYTGEAKKMKKGGKITSEAEGDE